MRFFATVKLEATITNYCFHVMILSMENFEELFDPRIVERIKDLRLMDDDLMSKVFSDDIEATQFLLRILLQNENLVVVESHAQTDLRNIFGRSIRLDILAEDSDHNLFNVEIQRSDKGAEPRRARYHAALLDSHFLKKNRDFSKLKNTFIIFITENDIWKKGFPFYEVQKHIKGTDLIYEDGLNVLYVNGAYRGNDAFGKLMHDFCCKDPEEMNYKELAQKVSFYKQQNMGVHTMCRAFEEYGKEIAEEVTQQVTQQVTSEVTKETKRLAVTNLLRQNLLPKEKIAEVMDLSLEEVLAIESGIKEAQV